MLSLHFNKQVFINTLNSKDSVVYGVTPLALMLTLLFQGMIKGNLKRILYVCDGCFFHILCVGLCRP